MLLRGSRGKQGSPVLFTAWAVQVKGGACVDKWVGAWVILGVMRYQASALAIRA